MVYIIGFFIINNIIVICKARVLHMQALYSTCMQALSYLSRIWFDGGQTGLELMIQLPTITS